MRNKISVIVPIYNVEKYLENCLQSIINQTYQNLEIILIDDGSTDESGFICNKYAQKDSRILVKHIRNAGQANARNIGLDMATGDYISFVDSDDWLEKNMLAELLTLCLDNDAQVSSCGYQKITKNSLSETSSEECYIKILSFKDIIKGLLSQNEVRFEVWNKLYDKKLLSDIRFKSGQLHEEVYFNKQVFFNINKMVYTNKKLYNYNANREGSTASSFKSSQLCIFDEFKTFSKELEQMNLLDEKKIIEAIATDFAVNFYYNATKLKVDKNIKKCLIECFKYFYRVDKSNMYQKKQKCKLFDLSPNLYCLIANLKARLAMA